MDRVTIGSRFREKFGEGEKRVAIAPYTSPVLNNSQENLLTLTKAASAIKGKVAHGSPRLTRLELNLVSVA